MLTLKKTKMKVYNYESVCLNCRRSC